VAHGDNARAADSFRTVAGRTHRKETPMSKLASLDDLLVHELQDIYHAEGQILKALPKMVDAATHPDLKDAFVEHLQQTEGQVRRLEQAFKLLGVPAKGKKCEGMAGLLEEGRKIMDLDMETAVMDAALIAAAQKVEHYEIASYGCVCTYAELLGYDQVHELLGQNLDEEETTDQKLTALAEDVINQEAEQPEFDLEEEEVEREA
jgi:ferritin-like metal-binding protein YciE